MARYPVSEVATKTGFSSSALRYYDELGLVRPVARTDAGYRLYDDRTVDRLAFIARAKRLGLSLDNIAELVALWDDDQCAPVQARLAQLVAEKLTDTQQAIAELVGFGAQLTELKERLAEHPHPGACDDRCACNTDVASGTGVPVVCDVRSAPDTVQERIESYRRLFADSFVGRERTVEGTRFRFRADEGVEARVRELALLEAQCCGFFTFTITVTGGEVLWDSTVIDHDTARTVLDEWFDLPETVDQGVDVVHARMASSGLQFAGDPLTRVPRS